MNRKLVCILTGVASFLFILKHSLGFIGAYDIFWHLGTARDFWENGLNPFVDQYSYTLLGKAIKTMSFGFQTIVYFLTELLGFRWGLVSYKMLTAFLTMGVWIRYCYQKKLHSSAVVFTSSVLLYALLIRLLSRPETLSYPLDIIFVFWALKLKNEKFEWKSVSYFLIGLWLWTQLHVSSVMGYVILGGLGFHQIYHRKEEWKQWVGVGLISIGIGFLNPALAHPFAPILSMKAGWGLLIAEMAPWQLNRLTEIQRGFWVALAILSVGFAYRKFWIGLVVSSVLLYYSFLHAKVFPHLVIICLPIATVFIREEVLKYQIKWFRYLKYVMVMASVGCGYLLVNQVSVNPGYRYTFAWQHAKRVVDYLEKINYTGRILNEHSSGGYLIYRMGTKMKLYIDGRTNILYSYEYLREYVFGSFRSELFSRIFKRSIKKNIPLVLIAPITEGRNYFLDRALELGQFEIAYEVGGWALLTPSKETAEKYEIPRTQASSFPLMSKIFREERCWKYWIGNKKFKKAFFKENQASKNDLPRGSELGLVIEFLNDYFNSSSSEAFIGKKMKHWLGSRRILRLGSIIASSQKRYKLAIEYRMAIKYRTLVDKQFILQMLIHLDDWSSAEKYYSELSYNSAARKEDLVEVMRLGKLIAQELENAQKFESAEKISKVILFLSRRAKRASTFDHKAFCEKYAPR